MRLSPFLQAAFLAGWLAVNVAPAAAVVSTQPRYLTIDGQRVFPVGSYSLPPGISPADLAASGFNFLFEEITPEEASGAGLHSSIMLYNTMAIPPGGPTAALMDTVNAHKHDPGLIVWHATDEPAWQSPIIPSADLVRGYDAIRQADDVLGVPRPVWLNHAARGTRAYPDSLDLLLPYNQAADILSIDIYPVPDYWGGSILPARGINSVGEYTRTLVDLQRDSTGVQTKPVWMVLQAFSWTDFNFTQPWYTTTRSSFDFNSVVKAVAGDFTGDGRTDVALLVAHGVFPASPETIYVARSNGVGFAAPVPWVTTYYGTFPFDRVSRIAAADASGDGKDDLILFANIPADRQKVVVAKSNGYGFNWYQTWWETSAAALPANDVYGLDAADFNADLLADVAIAFGGPDTLTVNPQKIQILRSTGGGFIALQTWRTDTHAELPYERIRWFRAGDYNDDGKGDVAMLYDSPSGSTQLLVTQGTGSSFAPWTTWWDSLATEFPAARVHGMTSHDLDGDHKDDLTLLYSENDAQPSNQWVFANLSTGDAFRSERWGVSWSQPYSFLDVPFAFPGDFNGDGLGDLGVVHDYTFPPTDPRQKLEVGLSYGRRFGVPGPTALESRFMAYDAVINGATGLIWWGLFYSGGPYEVWDGVKTTAQEISMLSRALTAEDAIYSVAVSDTSIETKLKRPPGLPYLLMSANRTPNVVTATLSTSALAGLTSATVVSEARTVPVSASSITDTFMPWAVHVYNFGPLSGVPGEEPAAVSLRADPAPFSSSTTIRFSHFREGTAEVSIFDVSGRRVRTLARRVLAAGEQSLRWDGRDDHGSTLPSGLYLVRLRAPGVDRSTKVLRVR